MNKPRILVIEDDRAVSSLDYDDPGNPGLSIPNGIERAVWSAGGCFRSGGCALLDLGLPDMDGVEIIRKLREWSHMPIIVVSARSEDRDKVEALDAGADDIRRSPSVWMSCSHVCALLCAVCVLTMRKLGEAAVTYQNGGLSIDYAAGCVYRDGQELSYAD